MPRILLAEPRPDFRRLLATWLRRVGHRVTEAIPGAKIPMRPRPDVLVAGLGGGGEAGLALAEGFRREAGVPAFLASWGGTAARLARAAALGAVALQKPFDLADLLRAVAVAAAEVGEPASA